MTELNSRHVGSSELGFQGNVLVTARYVFVWISPARLRAKHWNIPVSSGRRPLIWRLPPTNTLYLGIFTGLMGTASLYHTMSGCGVPAGGGEDLPCHCGPLASFVIFSCFLALSLMQFHRETQPYLVPDKGYPPPSPFLQWYDLVALLWTEDILFWWRRRRKKTTSNAILKPLKIHSTLYAYLIWPNYGKWAVAPLRKTTRTLSQSFLNLKVSVRRGMGM